MIRIIFILFFSSLLYSCWYQNNKIIKEVEENEDNLEMSYKRMWITDSTKNDDLKINKELININEITRDWDIEKSLWLIKDLYSKNINNLSIISTYADLLIIKWFVWDEEWIKKSINLVESFINNNTDVEKKKLVWLYSKLWYFYEIDSNFELAEQNYKLSIMLDKYNYEWHERLLWLYMNNKKYEDFNKNFEIALKKVRSNDNLTSIEKDYLFEKFNKIALEIVPKKNLKKWIIWE